MRVNRSPDPTGEQLQRLIPLLRTMVEQPSGGPGEACKWGIVWDFMSLPQRGRTTGYMADAGDRSPYEIARFGMGLGSINVRAHAACLCASPPAAG